ncbi:MAG: PDZ domain-containing protein [Planctomycetota bacterium]
MKQFLTTLTRAALVGGIVAGAVAPAEAQDEELARKIREEVKRELRPEFERLEKKQRQRLWEQFEKLVEQKVAERLAAARRAHPPRQPGPEVPPAAAGGKPVMGVSVSPTTAGVNALLDLGETGGLSVRRVDEGGPAEQAGLKVGDVITKIAGKRIGDLDALRNHLKNRRGGDTDEVEFLRQGKVRTVRFTYGAKGGGGQADVPPAAGDPAERVRAFLGGLNPSVLQQIQRLLDSVDDPTDRAEMLRLAERKLAEGFDGATAADLRELRRALKMGVKMYLAGAKAKLRDPKTRAELLEALLNRKLKSGRGAKSVEKLLDDILGEGGKKSAKPDTPEQPEEAPPAIDPEKFQEELQRVKERIERDGFPQDDAEVAKFVDTILKNVGLTRPQVRNLISSMGGPEQAKGIVRMQIQQLGITLTEDDLDRVLKVIMDDGEQSSGGDGSGGATRAKPGKIGCRLAPQANGAKVQSVTENSPAAKAGLRPGDLVLRFGGKSASSLDNVKSVLRGKAAGDTITIVVERNGREHTLTMTLEPRK